MARDALEMVVLSVLDEEPAYGYAITKKIETRSGGALAAGPSALYPLLKRLERQGLVEPSWEEVRSERAEPGARGRRRRWYRLTEKGRRRLAQQVERHRRHTAMLEAFIGRHGEPEAGS